MRLNFTTSAGTKAGGFASFASNEMILNNPRRWDSGTARLKASTEPSPASRRLKAAVCRPMRPRAENFVRLHAHRPRDRDLHRLFLLQRLHRRFEKGLGVQPAIRMGIAEQRAMAGRVGRLFRERRRAGARLVGENFLHVLDHRANDQQRAD